MFLNLKEALVVIILFIMLFLSCLDVLSDRIMCTSRRHARSTWSSFDLKKNFTRIYSDLNFYRRAKLSRHVVRSELAGAGSAGASSYPLSGVQEEVFS